MLRTNSKKAIENVKKYITDEVKDYIVNDYGTDEQDVDTFDKLAVEVWNIYKSEHGWGRYFGTQGDFEDYARGLALGGLFCYYYNRSAVEDLGDILEETDEEKARFDEEKAEYTLTYLIYREIKKGHDRQTKKAGF